MLLSASLVEGGRRKPIQLFRWPPDSFSAFNLGVSPKPIEMGAGGFFVCTHRLPLNVELAPSNTASTVRGLFRGRAYRSQIFPLAQTALAWASTCFLGDHAQHLDVASRSISMAFIRFPASPSEAFARTGYRSTTAVQVAQANVCRVVHVLFVATLHSTARCTLSFQSRLLQ